MLIENKFYSLIVLPCLAILLMFGGQVWAQTSKPNILVIWGDDIGRENAGVRCERTGLLLCSCSGDPDAALDHIRCQDIRRQIAGRCTDIDPGARVQR